MFWTLDFDDFASNVCNQGRYPLIGQVGTALQTASPPAVSPTSTSLHCTVAFLSHMHCIPVSFLFFFSFFSLFFFLLFLLFLT